MSFLSPLKVGQTRHVILTIILVTVMLMTLVSYFASDENSFQYKDPDTRNRQQDSDRSDPIIPSHATVASFDESITSNEESKPELSLNTPTDELMRLPLLERLRKVYPYTKSYEPLEKTIFQMWHEQIPLTDDMKSWTTDPDFDYHLVDAPSGYRLVLREFAEHFPEIIEAYNSMPKTILQYDFLRYLIVYLVGGTYGDTDTYQSTPLKDWITYNETNTIGAVVGIEVECDCETWVNKVLRRVQFCQWSFQGKRHHPFYALLINNIVNVTNTKYNKDTKIFTFDGQEFDFKAGREDFQTGVMWFTGPGIFTDTVYEYVNSLGPDIPIHNVNDQQRTRELTHFPYVKDKTWSVEQPDVWWGWQNLTRIDQPIVVDGDFVMLPEVAFRGSKSRPGNLVYHAFKGSWRDQKNQ